MDQRLIEESRRPAHADKPPIVVGLVRQELEQREPDEPPRASRH